MLLRSTSCVKFFFFGCIFKEMKKKPWVLKWSYPAAQPTFSPLELPADDRDLDFQEGNIFPRHISLGVPFLLFHPLSFFRYESKDFFLIFLNISNRRIPQVAPKYKIYKLENAGSLALTHLGNFCRGFRILLINDIPNLATLRRTHLSFTVCV